MHIHGELSQDNTHRFHCWKNLFTLNKIIHLPIVFVKFIYSLFFATTFLLSFPLVCFTCHHTLHKMTHLFGNYTPKPKRFSPIQHSNYFNVIQHSCTIVKMEATRFSETSLNIYQSQHLHISTDPISTSRTYLKPQIT